jgi:hypothetical protein
VKLFAAIVGVVAVLTVWVGVSDGTPKKLVATVGPNHTMSLKRNGSKVSKIAAGTYTITVRDRSDFHNFHLTGKGVAKRTGVSFIGTKTWTVTFKKGKRYHFQCDEHPGDMFGNFKAT